MRAFRPVKYWQDILLPILRRDDPPIIPQAVVMQGQQVLLVQRDTPHLWELPGGWMRDGESPEATIVREVYEETGLHVRVVELLGWYERTGWRPHRSPVYICCPLGGVLQPQLTEATAVRYFPPQALPTRMFPWYRAIVQQDMRSREPRPLQRRQHISLKVVLHCLALDLGGRLGLID